RRPRSRPTPRTASRPTLRAHGRHSDLRGSRHARPCHFPSHAREPRVNGPGCTSGGAGPAPPRVDPVDRGVATSGMQAMVMETPGRILGKVATRLLLENERVRIWEMDLAPGERSDTHRHEVDYLLVQIEGDRIAAVPEPDTEGKYRDYIEADVVPGRVHFIRRGGIETAINVGERRYREILIELK